MARQKPLQGDVFTSSKEYFFLHVFFQAAAQFGFQKRILNFLPALSHFESLRGSSHTPRKIKKANSLLGCLSEIAAGDWQLGWMLGSARGGSFPFIFCSHACFCGTASPWITSSQQTCARAS